MSGKVDCMKAITKSKSQVIYLYASTLLGSLLGFATSIVNTRFLTDAEYGDVRYVQNLITMLACLLQFGFFHAGNRLLALSDDETRSRRVRGAMVAILTVCSPTSRTWCCAPITPTACRCFSLIPCVESWRPHMRAGAGRSVASAR